MLTIGASTTVKYVYIPSTCFYTALSCHMILYDLLTYCTARQTLQFLL